MSKLEILDHVSPKEWNDAVIRLDGCPFHTYEWSLFSSESNHAVPLYFILNDDSGGLSALSFGLKRQKTLLGVSLSKTLSFGSLPAYKRMTALKEMVRALISFCRSEGFVSLEINSFGTPHESEMLGDFGFTLARRCEFLIDLTLPNEELWKKLHAMKRRNIRKAEKESLSVVHDVESGQITKYRRLALETERRKTSQGIAFRVAAPPYYELLEKRVIEPRLGRLYLAYNGQELVAGALFVGYNQKVYYVLGASSDKGLEKRGPDLLLWTSIADYQKEGYRLFNMGGVSEKDLGGGLLEESGLYQFKNRFAADAHLCYKGTLIFRPYQLRLHSLLKNIKARFAARFV